MVQHQCSLYQVETIFRPNPLMFPTIFGPGLQRILIPARNHEGKKITFYKKLVHGCFMSVWRLGSNSNQEHAPQDSWFENQSVSFPEASSWFHSFPGQRHL